MKKLTILILFLVSLQLKAQIYYEGKFSMIPSRTISLNDFGAKGDNSTTDATIVKSVLRLADQKGYRVTGSGTFNFNGDSAKLNNVDLWAVNKGSFVIRNGGFFMPKQSFKAQNVVFNDWTATGSGVVFWDTVRNSSGVIINDGWPERNFVLQVDNVDFNNVNNGFYCQQDPPKDSSSLYNSYIKNVNVNGFRYSAIKLPFIHYGLTLENINIENVTNGGTNFSAGINIGIDGAERYYSYGLKISSVKIKNVKADTVTASVYGILAYTNGALIQGIQFNEVGAPLYVSGDDNQITNIILINDTIKSKHGVIVKGGANSFSKFTNISDVQVRGKFLTGIYVDHRGDKMQLYNNQVLVDNDPYNVGDGALRIISHGFNSIDIAGGSYENRQTNDATAGIQISTDDTIYSVNISGITMISESNGISVNSERIKSFEVHDNPVLYAATDHTFKTAGTNVSNSTIYYNRGATYAIGLNSSNPVYFKNNRFKPYYKSFGTSSLGRLFDISNDEATDSTFYYFSGNEYDLSGATYAFYVSNKVYFKMTGEKLTNTSAANTNFYNVRSTAGWLDIEAKFIDMPFGKAFITTGLGGTGERVKLKIANSNLTGTVIGFTSGTQANLSKDSLWIESTSLPANPVVGEGWIAKKINDFVDFNGNHFMLNGGVVSLKQNVISGASSLPFIYVTDAVGDGLTDNTAVIRAAIDSANSQGGGIVWLPVGNFVTDSLHLPRRVSLIGAGVGATILKLKANTTASMMLSLHNTDEARVMDITFDGNKQNQTDSINGLVIDTDAGSNVPGFPPGTGDPTNYNYQLVVERVYVRNFTGNGIVALHPAWVFAVRNYRVRDCDGWGVWNESTDSEFNDNGVSNNGLGGIYNRGANTRFIGGKVLWNGRDNPNGAGIYCYGGNRSQFIGMEIQESYYHGLVLDNTSDAVVQVVSDMNNTKRRPDSLQLGADIDSQDVNAVGYALKMIGAKNNSVNVQITSGFEGAKFTQFGKYVDGNSVNNTFIINERKPMLGDSIVFAGKNTWITYQDANKIISTDGNFSVSEDTSTYIITSTLTANRTIILPNPAKTLMKKLVFVVRTAGTYKWAFDLSVSDVTPTPTITQLPDNSVVTIERFDNGSGQWRITNIWEPLKFSFSRDLVKINDANHTIPTGTGDYTAVYFGTMTGARTLFLPPAADNTKRRITIKHGGDGNFDIILSPAVKSNASTATASIGQGSSIMVESDGTDWIKVY